VLRAGLPFTRASSTTSTSRPAPSWPLTASRARPKCRYKSTTCRPPASTSGS
jgi:hypothetical protein